MRFCMVTTFYPPHHFGGDAIAVYRLSEALAQRGHEVDVIHSADAYRLQASGEPPDDFAHHPRVTRHVLRSPRPALAALASHQLGRPGPYGRRLRRILESRRPDVIHFHNVSLVGGPGVLRFGDADAVRLYTVHEYWLICPTHVLFRFGREACTRRTCLRCTLHARRPPQPWRATGHLARCLAAVDRVLMPSRFARDRHRAQGLDRPTTMLPPIVPVPDEIPRADRPGRPTFLYAGRLESLKGVDELVDAFAANRGADLVVAGDGSLGPALRDRARDLPHVRFRGSLHPDELAALYRGATAVVAPSRCYETFGLSVAEALAHGTPAIVRRHGALAELVDDTGAGWTFGSADELRQALEAAAADPDRCRAMGELGRDAARRWSADAHLDTYLGLVEELLERRGKRP